MSTLSRGGEPVVLGLLDRRVEGDDALLELARRRLEQAGLGAEVYAAEAEQLGHVRRYRPRTRVPMAVHLPRDLDLLSRAGRAMVGRMARAGQGDVAVMVVHDQAEVQTDETRYVEALREVDGELGALKEAPVLCVEYAAGLDPGQFEAMFERAGPLEHVGACVDIGHVAVAWARRAFRQVHPALDLAALDPRDAGLRSLIGDVVSVSRAGRNAALRLTGALAALGALRHVHLHDAHPLWRASPWGVLDHLSFLESVPLPFEHEGRWSLDTVFGPGGLAEVVEQALGGVDRNVSFTLEIHPSGGRRELGDAAELFSHWRDFENAERMNQWLSVVRDNHRLLRAVFAQVAARRAR